METDFQRGVRKGATGEDLTENAPTQERIGWFWSAFGAGRLTPRPADAAALPVANESAATEPTAVTGGTADD